MTKIDMTELATVTGGTPQAYRKLITLAADGVKQGASFALNLTKGGGFLKAKTGFRVKAGQTINLHNAEIGAPAH